MCLQLYQAGNSISTTLGIICFCNKLLWNRLQIRGFLVDCLYTVKEEEPMQYKLIMCSPDSQLAIIIVEASKINIAILNQPTSPSQYSAVKVQKLRSFSKHAPTTQIRLEAIQLRTYIVMLFSSWVSSEPSLTVTGTVLSVDPTCPVELESLTDED